MPPLTARFRGIGAAPALALSRRAGAGAAPASAETLGSDGLPIRNADGVIFGVTAHRGGALERPENSLEAFQYSVDQGFDAIETDLLFTLDGYGVLTHYDTLPARCGAHAGQQIHLMTLEQVREVRCLDLSGGYTVPIPTFDEFAAIVASSPISIQLDVKTYPGQPASGERLYAQRAVELLTQYGLVDRTGIISFRWVSALPVIRALAPNLRVIALDNKPMRFSRVTLAAKLGATGYGVKIVNTPVNLMETIRAKGMVPVAWDIRGDEMLAYSIHFGSAIRHLSTDTPDATRTALLAGQIDINPKPRTVRTALPKAVTIAKKATYKAKKRTYPQVMGVAVPADQLSMLQTVTLSVKVTKGPGKGYLYAGAKGSTLKSSVKVKLPRGTKTIKLKVPVGDDGQIRLYTSRKAKLTVKAVEYTHLRFN